MRRSKAGVSCVVGAMLVVALAGGCGDNDEGTDQCPIELQFEAGGDGHAEPLGADATHARAGRAKAEHLPPTPAGLVTWAAGDFILANDKIALVIEDVGPSDQYDPWGGRPVGFGRVENGQMIEPADFGEVLLLTGRYTVVTERVGVINDGTDGNPAVVRASGKLSPLPFFDNIVGSLLRDDLDGIHASIEYVLAPGAEHVEIYFTYASPHAVPTKVNVLLHAFMYAERMPTYAPGVGFDTTGKTVPWLGVIADGATSYGYDIPGQELKGGIAASGFTSQFSDGFEIAACDRTRHLHARMHLGGPGLDGLRQAVTRTRGEAQRAITGKVERADGAPAANVRVHAEDTNLGYLTRAWTDEAGNYTLHVPADAAVQLTAFRRGDLISGPTQVPVGTNTADFTLAASGMISVTTTELGSGNELPVRIQVLPTTQDVPWISPHFGEPSITSGRMHVTYAMDGKATFRLPEGSWDVVVSRGYEYELYQETVSVTAGNTVDVTATIEHVVQLPGNLCADYHIHTNRSNDSGDDGLIKVMSAAADGLHLPIRSEHEYAVDFQPEIQKLGLEDYMAAVASVEMTSMEIWGHMGVLPLDPDPTKVNGGTPLWQTFPSATEQNAPVVTLSPVEVFETVRARPEQPLIIINHPRGGANYFDYAQYDADTGIAGVPEVWDEEFKVVEVFNSSSWKQQFDRTVKDWLSFLNNGRRVFAVGSSDSHSISGSPVGYPRTCLDLGTDDPRQVTPAMVRDATGAGKSTVVGGIYVTATIDGKGPGEDATGLGDTTMVDIKVQAATWVDVDAIDVVVDGQIVTTIDILPDDADPMDATIRYHKQVSVDVAAGMGGYVIVAAYGDRAMDPVHRNRIPFGVTNPIFVSR